MAVDGKIWVGIHYRSELQNRFLEITKKRGIDLMPRAKAILLRLAELDPDIHEREIEDSARRLLAEVEELRSRDEMLRGKLTYLRNGLVYTVDAMDRYYHRTNAFYIEQLAEELGISTWSEERENAFRGGYYDYSREEAQNVVLQNAIREWGIDRSEIDETNPDTWGLDETEMVELRGRIERAEEQAERKAEDEEFRDWNRCVERAITPVFEEHGLELIGVEGHPDGTVMLVEPKESWFKAAEALRETINGVGMFYFDSMEEFLDSGPYTPRQVVLTHLHWLRQAHEVYGGNSPPRLYDSCRRR